MFAKRVSYASIPFLLLAFISPCPWQNADLPKDSKEVSDLLSQAKTQAAQLKQDAEDMESFTRSNVGWESHAAKITEIKRSM